MQHYKMSHFSTAYSPQNLSKAEADFMHTIHCMKSEFCSPNSASLYLLLQGGGTRVYRFLVLYSKLCFVFSESMLIISVQPVIAFNIYLLTQYLNYFLILVFSVAYIFKFSPTIDKAVCSVTFNVLAS